MTDIGLALFDHYVWNYSVGDMVRNSIVAASDGWNYYFTPLLVIAVPLYGLWANAQTLIVLQTVAVASGVFPIYWFARQEIGNGPAVAVAASYLLYPALAYVNLDQFQAISLTVPLASFALFFVLRQRYRPFLVCSVLLVLVKEEALFVVLGFALYVFLVQRQRVLGISMLFLTSLWFLVLIQVLFPALTGRSYFLARGHLFGPEGTGISSVVSNLVSHPEQLWALLWSPVNLEFVWSLLLPLAFLPLVGLDVLLVVLPYLGMSFITHTPFIASHYPAGLIPGIYFAAVVGLRRVIGMDVLDRLAFLRGRALAPCFVLLLASFGGAIWLGPLGPYSRITWGYNSFGGNTAVGKLFSFVRSDWSSYREWIDLVPPRAFVVAQEDVLSHFSARKDIIALSPHFEYRQADYVVGKKDLFFYNFHRETWDAWWSSGYFQMLFDKDGFFVAKRKPPSVPLDVRFGTSIRLIGYTIWPEPPITGGMTLKPIFTWEALQPISEKCTFRIQMVDSKGHVWAARTFEASTPLSQWKPGEMVGDQYSLNLPPVMPSGDYQLVVEVHRANGEYLEAVSPEGEPLSTGVVLTTMQVKKSNQEIIASNLEMGNRLYVDLQDLRFLGYELNGQSFAPTDVVQLGLYWKARTKPAADYIVSIQLRDSENHILLEQSSRPASGTFPTTMWQAGEGLLDWHDLTLPSSIPSGKFSLYVVLQNADSKANLGQVQLPEITVEN